MTNCKYIDKRGICRLKGCYAANHKCFGEDMCKCIEPITNAEYIRRMTDEELHELLKTVSLHPMRGSILNWLKQPYEECEK